MRVLLHLLILTCSYHVLQAYRRDVKTILDEDENGPDIEDELDYKTIRSLPDPQPRGGRGGRLGGRYRRGGGSGGVCCVVDLTPGEIIGIIFGSVFGLAFLLTLLTYCCEYCKRRANRPTKLWHVGPTYSERMEMMKKRKQETQPLECS